MPQTDEIIYQSNLITLYHHLDSLFFIYNNTTYQLTSHPFEPCLYVSQEEKIVRMIHNAFTIEEMMDVARGEYQITSVTGKKYDIESICEVLSGALELDSYETDLSYLEANFLKKQKQNDEAVLQTNISISDQNAVDSQLLHITELTEDPFYEEYTKYPEVVLDYCILKIDSNKHTQNEHQQVVLFAMHKWQTFLNREYEVEIDCHPEKMKAKLIDSKDFFNQSADNKKSYRYLFLNPPHGYEYEESVFDSMNRILFPNGVEGLEVYDWSTDWSNYFDDGHEWWGTRCVSIYDQSLNRFVVIGASATD